MKILLVHNRYIHEGGEDMVFAATADMLKSRGHSVVTYTRDNHRLRGPGRWSMAVTAHWSPGSAERLTALIRAGKPDVAHFHNTFPLISPSALYACGKAGVAVVQTLHNYRLLCPGALLMRKGRLCHDCIGHTPPWPAILHACYRESRLQSAAAASMLTLHRMLSTWNRQVDMFIALSEYARRQFIRGGLPREKLTVLSNFIHPDPLRKTAAGGYAVYAGRLSREKGISLLLDAWCMLPDVPLYIAGDGPLMDRANAFARAHRGAEVRVLGRMPRHEVLDVMRGARLLVFPSECPENFPMAIAEAFACGIPVAASGIGAAAEMVAHGRTGLLFPPGDPQGLAEAVRALWASPDNAAAMGRAARAEYEARYTAEKNYPALMEIYARAIASRKGKAGR